MRRRTFLASAASTTLRVPSTLSRVCCAFPPRHMLVLPATWKTVSVPVGIAALRGRHYFGSLPEHGLQPTFCLVHRKSLALGIVGHLIAVNLADAEIVRFRVGKIKPAHRRCGQHRKRFRQM